jgi:anti-sigma regulatory factor (Ser/Thr protein kinase)
MGIREINGPVVLNIPADPASLFLVRGLVERLALRLDFVKPEVDRMVLAVDEACSNIIRHAYDLKPDGRIVITFRVDPGSLEIEVRDYGKCSDPSAFKSRDLSDVRPGGLGLHFIKAAMDVVEYQAPEGGGMLLRMVKMRTVREGASS